jgi:hypothetical protein
LNQFQAQEQKRSETVLNALKVAASLEDIKKLKLIVISPLD